MYYNNINSLHTLLDFDANFSFISEVCINKVYYYSIYITNDYNFNI